MTDVGHGLRFLPNRFLIYLFAGLLIDGCGGASQKWPPGSIALSEYYSEHHLIFADLDEEFVSGEWERLCSGFGVSELIVESPGEQEQHLSSPKARKIRELLDKAGMYCIQKGRGQLVQYEPYYSNSVSGYFYKVHLTHFGDKTSIDECDIYDSQREEGSCVVTLDADWQIDYVWWTESEK